MAPVEGRHVLLKLKYPEKADNKLNEELNINDITPLAIEQTPKVSESKLNAQRLYYRKHGFKTNNKRPVHERLGSKERKKSQLFQHNERTFIKPRIKKTSRGFITKTFAQERLNLLCKALQAQVANKKEFKQQAPLFTKKYQGLASSNNSPGLNSQGLNLQCPNSQAYSLQGKNPLFGQKAMQQLCQSLQVKIKNNIVKPWYMHSVKGSCSDEIQNIINIIQSGQHVNHEIENAPIYNNGFTNTSLHIRFSGLP